MTVRICRDAEEKILQQNAFAYDTWSASHFLPVTSPNFHRFVVDNDACVKFSLFSDTDVSQGRSAIHVRCGGIFNDDFVAYLLVNVSAKKILKIDQHLAKLWTIL